jgi:sirohydrochlorin cobaltochelatase
MQAIVLFGHGSRDPSWRRPMEMVAERIRSQRAQVQVRCAYLELDTPTLPDAAAELMGLGVTQLTVLPMFLGAGRHAREDLPRLVEQVRQTCRGLQLRVLPSAGEDPRVLDLLAQIALE